MGGTMSGCYVPPHEPYQLASPAQKVQTQQRVVAAWTTYQAPTPTTQVTHSRDESTSSSLQQAAASPVRPMPKGVGRILLPRLNEIGFRPPDSRPTVADLLAGAPLELSRAAESCQTAAAVVLAAIRALYAVFNAAQKRSTWMAEFMVYLHELECDAVGASSALAQVDSCRQLAARLHQCLVLLVDITLRPRRAGVDASIISLSDEALLVRERRELDVLKRAAFSTTRTTSSPTPPPPNEEKAPQKPARLSVNEIRDILVRAAANDVVAPPSPQDDSDDD